MLRFFREKAHIIGLTIVITFGVTMFAGSVFMGRYSEGDSTGTAQDFSSEIAVLGDQPVSRSEISLNLNRIASQLNLSQTGGRLTPEMLEIIQYNALLQTVQNMILRQGAKELGVIADKFDIAQAMDVVFRENDLKDKKALKTVLKKQGVDYKKYMDFIRQDIVVRKFASKLKDDIQVTDQDVENKYSELKGRHILFIVDDIENSSEKEELANLVYSKLQAGLSFSEAVRLYSDDKNNKKKDGDLGWFDQGTYVAEIENTMYVLKKGEYSRPIRSQYGFHIVQLTDKRQLNKPVSFDLTTEKQKLLQSRQEQRLEYYVNTEILKKGLLVQDPFFKAFYSKNKGQVLEAISAYNQQISRNPYSPVPHYLLAQLYVVDSKQEEALQELKRAEVKAELSEEYVFPEVYVLMGTIYKNKKDKKSALSKYDKAFELGKDNLFILKRLREELKDLNQSTRIKKINQSIVEQERILEESQNQKSQDQPTSS